MADWSSLPSDLITRIGDCLLATNDVDCYMDFRAVCTNWRSSTDDPKNSSKLRFRPRRWIIIDEVFESDSRLLVNTLSGRIVRKDLPLLRRFYVVATTHGGFFVLAEKKPSHAVCLLNPFTGHMIHFMATLPSDMDVSSAAVMGSSPTIVLIADSQRNFMQYVADPHSECFTIHGELDYHDTLNRLAFLGGVYGDVERAPLAPIPDGVAANIYDLMTMFPTMFPRMSLAKCCFVAEFAGQVFIILKLQRRMVVFKLDSDSGVLEPVSSIANVAIFVGHGRCFTVDAEMFPSIGASCIYYVKPTDAHGDIYKYDLKEEKEERVSQAIDSLKVPASSLSTTTPPFTLIQLLSSYTTNVRPSELKVEDTRHYWSDYSLYEDMYSDE
jgi:hypothetical protein